MEEYKMRSILYYPFIAVKDGEWLRNAILYWDEVCTIVPTRDFAAMTPELQYLQDRGCYRPIVPYDVFPLGKPREFAEASTRYFSHIIKSQNDLRRKYYKEQITPQRIYDPSLHSLLHYKKLPDETLLLLSKCGIQQDNDGWIIMPTNTARNYMKLLAEFAAKYAETDMVVGTDTIQSLTQLYPAIHSSKNAVLSIVFNNCLPVPSMDVGLEELLDFKDMRKDELYEFWEKIRGLEKAISDCQNILQIKSELINFRQSWEREIDNYSRLFSDGKIKTIIGSLRAFITDAGAAGTLAQFAHPLNILSARTEIAAVLGYGLIGVGRYYMNYRKRINESLHNSGFAYVVSANKQGLIHPNNQPRIIV